MTLLSESYLKIEMSVAEAEIILGLVEYYLVQVRKIQHINKQRIEDFIIPYNKQIEIYKQLAGFLNKENIAKEVIKNLADNIESYFSEGERQQYGIGVPDVQNAAFEYTDAEIIHNFINNQEEIA